MAALAFRIYPLCQMRLKQAWVDSITTYGMTEILHGRK